MIVHYTNADDECSELSPFDASAGIMFPLLIFREFCGTDSFCANLELGADDDTGLHISLDSLDVTLRQIPLIA
jgi:hypothetical protein